MNINFGVNESLNESLKNLLEENILKILLFGAEDFTSQMTSEILKHTIKFIKNKCLVFNIFHMYFMFNLCTEFTVSSICLT